MITIEITHLWIWLLRACTDAIAAHLVAQPPCIFRKLGFRMFCFSLPVARKSLCGV